MSCTVATQSRIASLIASFSVRGRSRPAHFGAEHAHAEDVQRLARHVVRAHVDDAFQAEQRADGGGGHAVLPRTGLGDDAALAHPAGEQRLAERVVDLVRAGVSEILALQKNRRAAARLGQPVRFVERGRAADEMPQQMLELGEKAWSSRTAKYASVSASIGATSVSGTNRPPNSPK